MGRRVLAAAAAVWCITSGCGATTEGIRTQFIGSHAFSGTERRTISRIAGAAYREAKVHLPTLSPRILLEVRSGTDVIPEFGATAVVAGSEYIRWTVNPDHPDGVVKIAETQLRATLFHEFHHLVRGATVPPATLMDHVITEGMASAFERDFAGAAYPWSHYPPDVSTWVDELIALPPSASQGEWMRGLRPDGRRWVGMRAGTYLVDEATKVLSRTSADLVSTPTAEILLAVGVKGPH